MSQHLRRRRDLQENSRAGGLSGAGAAAAALDLSNSGSRSNAGGRSTTGAVRRQGSGVDPKDKSAPQSMHGGTDTAMEEHMTVSGVTGQGASESYKIAAAYPGPISSITKHYFMVSCIGRIVWVVVGAVAVTQHCHLERMGLCSCSCHCADASRPGMAPTTAASPDLLRGHLNLPTNLMLPRREVVAPLAWPGLAAAAAAAAVATPASSMSMPV